MLKKGMLERFRVKPGAQIRLKDVPTDWVGSKELRKLGEDIIKQKARAVLERSRAELAEAQELLYASDRYSVLVIFQAMDAAGKDGTIRHVMSGVNPQGCQVFSFKRPSEEELDHDFLWRCACRLPERGRIGIFNRSYYEEVLIVRVHPELLHRQKLPPGPRGRQFWEDRYEDINQFERHLARNGTLLLKFFLHVSKQEQKRRFLARLAKPEKHWKFSLADVAERAYWKEYMEAYEDAVRATSTRWAPWFIIPADRKYVARALVAAIITDAIQELDLKYPHLSKDQLTELAEAKRLLEAE
jgi:PPK2 family polyphosphate:nucleotide phosphotransferase